MYKSNLSYNKKIKFKAWIIELLEENIHEMLHDMVMGKELLDKTLKSQELEEN